MRFLALRETEALPDGAFLAPEREAETFEELRQRLTHLSFLPHWNGAVPVRMAPAGMDPGYYDGPTRYRLTSSLQTPLEAVLKKNPFIGSRVALVDLTKDRNLPEFAGVRHMEQVFIASVAKIAALFAAFQLQRDLRAIARRPSPTGARVFDWARELWADTQHDHGGAAVPFTKDISLRGKLVLVKGKKLALTDPRAPRLEDVFASGARPFAFASTPKTRDELAKIIKDFSVPAINTLGFMQRMMIVGGGLVPASNLVVATLVRDLGYPYIASSLIQSGLYDPARGGGLWLGADFHSTLWSSAPAGGPAQSGTAGSLATFMTLLAQDRLVSPAASQGILDLLDKDSAVQPTLRSPFEDGLEARYGPAQVFEKVGAAGGGEDECAFIEWPSKAPRLKYVAVSLRSSEAALKKLIVELHKIVAANNGVSLP